MLREIVSKHQRLPPQKFQSGMGGFYDLTWRAFFHDERGDDNGIAVSDGCRAASTVGEDEMVEQHGRWKHEPHVTWAADAEQQ